METRLIRFLAVFLGLICIFGAGFAARKNLKAFGGRFYAATKETLIHGVGGEGENNKERIYLGENDNHNSSDSYESADKENVSEASLPLQEADNFSENFSVDKEQQKAPQQCDFKSGQFPSRQDVILNEVAWMGSESSANDEWIELKNIGSNDFDVSGWQIVDMDGQINVVLGDDVKIKAKGLYLLERTDDSAVSSVSADVIYQGALSDANEALRLFDNRCNLVDEVFANVGSAANWPAGDKLLKKTMERNTDNPEWHTSEKSGGTPRAENTVPMPSVQLAENDATSTEPVGPTDDAPSEVSSPASSPLELRVLINEVQIAGETADDEFVELYNPTAQPIDMTGWFLKKKSSSGSESTIATASRFENKIIAAHGYLLLAHTESYKGASAPDIEWPKSYTIAANNTLLLYRNDGIVADKLGFGSAVDFEGIPFPENPVAYQSISRFNGSDSDSNAEDFLITPASPQNSAAQ